MPLCNLLLLCLSLSSLNPGASRHGGEGDRPVRQPGQSEANVEAGPRLQEGHRPHHAEGS